MTRANARYALKPEDRPPNERTERLSVKEAKDELAKYKSEDEIQIEVATYLDRALPKGWLWYHCPNGGHRLKAVAGKLKAMGVKPGIPDCVILRPNGAAIYIELKAFGGVLSLAQKQFRGWCIESKQPYHVARSVGDVVMILKDFMA